MPDSSYHWPPYHCHDWVVIHGDSDQTPWFALTTRAGAAVDLTDATLRAQVRNRSGELVHTFTLGTGILVGSGEVTFTDGRPAIVTAAVRLALSLVDSEALPRKLRDGAYDLEITRAGKRRTALGGSFYVVADVSHD